MNVISSGIYVYADIKSDDKMAIKLYSTPHSPPCQTVIFTGQCLELEFETVPTTPMNGDTKNPEYLEINPQHVIPTLVDEDGFIVWESRTIARYLVQKYGKDDSLYPTELKKRTNVDKMLDFDIGTLYKRLIDYIIPLFKTGSLDEDVLPSLEDGILVLEKCLEKNSFGWVASDSMTIADISLFVTVNSLALLDHDLSKYSLVTKWLDSVKSTIPNYDTIGIETENDFKQFFNSIKKPESP